MEDGEGGGEEMTAKRLIDQILPRWDLAVTHAGVFPVPPPVGYQTARRIDFFQAPLIRTLIGLAGCRSGWRPS
jgi:hypothetical protein